MNLEQFPTSETAKKMLGYITGNGFYDNFLCREMDIPGHGRRDG